MTGTFIAIIAWIDPIGRSLREGFFMFWETLWPLILGFGLSGVVQSFVSRDALQRKLGNHGVVATARASAYGMVSSSCSYAASAMSKSLFVKGADFVSTLVFMFASTNLVVELGVILVVLMGWQFAASEFIGGAIMIALLATSAGLWFRGREIEAARAELIRQSPSLSTSAHATHDHLDQHEASPTMSDEPSSERSSTGARSLRSPSGWANAATYTMADLTMLRKEMVVGYGIAGFLATLIPTRWWNVVFLHGHGFWTSVENVVVGPFIAIISFVCSVGNVPLAAALWHGGISFGGVVSFIFADLIAFPLLLIYRRYYGTKMMVKMLAIFWVVMAAAGLLTEGLFTVAHLVPTTRSTQVVAAHFSWNYTTYLNIVFLILFGFIYWVYRHSARFGGGDGYAIDPVCGMQVEIAHAPAVLEHEGSAVYFCSDHCRDRFKSESNGAHTHAASSSSGASSEVIDPICGMTVDPATARYSSRRDDVQYYFCSQGCVERFDRESMAHHHGT